MARCRNDERPQFNCNIMRKTVFASRGPEIQEASSNNRRRMSLDDIKSSTKQAGMRPGNNLGEVRGLERKRSDSRVKVKHLNTLMIYSFSPSQDPHREKSAHKLSTSNPTEYLLIFDDIQTARKWQIRRRYSEFFQLNQSIWALFGLSNQKNCQSDVKLQHQCVKCVSAFQAILFPLQQQFPKKNWFHSKNHHVIEKRSQYFRNYLLTWLAVTTGRKIYWDQLRKFSCDEFVAAKALKSTFTPQLHGLCRKVIAALKPILSRFFTTRAMRYNCISGEHGGCVQFNVPSLLSELKCARRRNTLEPIDEKRSSLYASDTDSEYEEEETKEYRLAVTRDNHVEK